MNIRYCAAKSTVSRGQKFIQQQIHIGGGRSNRQWGPRSWTLLRDSRIGIRINGIPRFRIQTLDFHGRAISALVRLML